MSKFEETNFETRTMGAMSADELVPMKLEMQSEMTRTNHDETAAV